MHPVSNSNTHHDVTNVVNIGWLRIQKLEYLKTEHNFPIKQKKFLTCASDGTF